MERSKAYIIALVAGAVAVIIAVALMVSCIAGTDSGSELTVSAGTPSSGEAPLGDEGMPSDKDGNFAPPDDGGGRMPRDLPEMDGEQAQMMPGMIAAEGVDTTDAEAALGEGDMDTVIAFIGEYMPARQEGPGGFPEGEAPEK
jgi:hypothetical protein